MIPVETTYMSARARSGQGVLSIMVAAVLWGTVGIATRGLYALYTTTPLSIGLMRLALSVPALALACWFVLGRRGFALRSWRDFGLMTLTGALTALYQVCYFAAIARVGVGIAVLVTLCVAPVLVALLGGV
ncbi:MAG: EamA family transporter, partial [Chloroflexales bacterium]|nr:EamA family transporter [Chloroflexales bacterium]